MKTLWWGMKLPWHCNNFGLAVKHSTFGGVPFRGFTRLVAGGFLKVHRRATLRDNASDQKAKTYLRFSHAPRLLLSPGNTSVPPSFISAGSEAALPNGLGLIGSACGTWDTGVCGRAAAIVLRLCAQHSSSGRASPTGNRPGPWARARTANIVPLQALRDAYRHEGWRVNETISRDWSHGAKDVHRPE